MLAACLFVTRFLVEGSNVLVHCIAGKHRTGLFASTLLAFLTGCSFDEALQQFASKRSLTAGDKYICNTMANELRLASWIESHRDFPPLASDVRAIGALRPVPKRMPQPPGSRDHMPRGSRSRSRSRSRSPGSRGQDMQESDEMPGSRGQDVQESDEMPAHGAWQCPECNNLNKKWLHLCARPDCNGERPLMQDFLPGDWFCKVCGNHNFKRRTKCAFLNCPTMKYKPGDWFCPACSHHNFAKRSMCWKCKEVKPDANRYTTEELRGKTLPPPLRPQPGHGLGWESNPAHTLGFQLYGPKLLFFGFWSNVRTGL